MASYLDKVQINTPVTDNTKLDLGHVHITTSSPFSLQPVMVKEMIPGEKFDINVETFSRMNPLAVPTFGRFNIKNRAFFVPYRTVFRAFNDFVTDVPHIDSTWDPDGNGNVGLVNSVPTVLNSALVQAFNSSTGTTIEDTEYLTFPGTSTDYDLRLYNGSSGYVYKKFTYVGMTAMRNLESLGYKVNPNMADHTEFSGLPLLCMARIYADYYWPNQYTADMVYDQLIGMCNADYDSGRGIELSSSQVALILLTTSYSNYESSIYTSAWDVPNQPSTGTVSTDFKLVNIDSVRSLYASSALTPVQDGYVTNWNNGLAANATTRVNKADAPVISPYISAVNSSGSTTSAVTPISQYLLHSLHALTDWMKRNQLSGSKSYERFLARFGKALPAEKIGRSLYLGGDSVPLQIGDVMSTADTTGAGLGDYAGKGLGYGGSHFSYSTDEFGLFVVLSSIVPVTGYFQGIDPLVKRVHKLDFYNGEFDSLGCEPITSDMLYVSQGSTGGGDGLIDPAIHTHVFGWAPRYFAYKCQIQDKVTGNFRVPTLNGALGSATPVEFNAANSWHLMRTFNDDTWADDQGSPDFAEVVHSPDFIRGRIDGHQYNRIFANAKSDSPDQFTLIYNFDAVSYSPVKALYDTYEFEDKGKKVTMDVNGVKMN